MHRRSLCVSIPFLRQAQCPLQKLSFEDFHRADVDRCLKFAISEFRRNALMVGVGDADCSIPPPDTR
jgi:hypothetical protein